MKHSIIILFVISGWLNTEAQELQQVWKSPAGTEINREQNSYWPGTCSTCLTQDFDGDGTSDLAWLSTARRSIIIVNGKDRDLRYELPLESTLTGNANHLEVYLIDNLSPGTVNIGLCNNEVVQGSGVREDTKVKIQDQVLTWPKNLVLLELEDYDQDGQTDLRFLNREERRTEIWSL